MRLIILAAGQGFKLDNFNKLLIKDPVSGDTLIQKYLKLFQGYEITIVVGYNAINIMQEHPENHEPDLTYVYNHEWKTTKNSSSLALTLTDEPCVVISGDLFFDERMVELIDKCPNNSVLVCKNQNKNHNIRCICKKDGTIKSIYWSKEYANDLETIGIFKICNKQILKEWKNNCLKNKDKFVAQNLPIDKNSIFAIDKKDLFFHEINTHQDYISLMEKVKK